MVKSLNYGEIEQKAEAALRALLGGIPFLKTRIKRMIADDDSQIDFVADLQVSGTPKKLIIECKSTGEPRSLPACARCWSTIFRPQLMAFSPGGRRSSPSCGDSKRIQLTSLCQCFRSNSKFSPR
jgi:hypothetical protein